MLSGIRTGKKKAKAPPPTKSKSSDPPPPHNPVQEEDDVTNASATNQVSLTTPNNDNLSAADRIRQALAFGVSQIPSSVKNVQVSSTQSGSVIDLLERRGRIETSDTSNSSNPQNDVAAVIVQLPLGSNASTVGMLPSSKNNGEDGMTIQEMVAQERRETLQGTTWDEQMTRNLARLGKKRRRGDKNTDLDSDEEVEKLQRLLPGHDSASSKSATAAAVTPKQQLKQQLAMAKSQQRDRHRLLHSKAQEEKITSKCSWWLESSSFQKNRLIALGNHLSLIMAPTNASLVHGHHFYLVPLKHAASFVDVADDMGITNELEKFRHSLQNLYARQGKSILFLETVLPNRGFWQTKIEVVPVPFHVWQDAPLFFQSAMREQAKDWGTHTKIMPLSVPHKPLAKVIPKGFPYFAVDWGKVNTSPHTGYAQILESQNDGESATGGGGGSSSSINNAQHDFGLDTEVGRTRLESHVRFYDE